MADKPISAELYQRTLQQLGLFAGLVRELPLAEMLEAQSRADNVAWFIDPRLLREKGKAFQQDRALTQAFRSLQLDLEKLTAPIREGGHSHG